MEKQGWKDGEGLGHSQVGIPEALENEGQHPNCKRGFGCVNKEYLKNALFLVYKGQKLMLWFIFLQVSWRKTDHASCEKDQKGCPYINSV